MQSSSSPQPSTSSNLTSPPSSSHLLASPPNHTSLLPLPHCESESPTPQADDGNPSLDPQPGPSTSAAEFDLEVFDSGSSCSPEDCWRKGVIKDSPRFRGKDLLRKSKRTSVLCKKKKKKTSEVAAIICPSSKALGSPSFDLEDDIEEGHDGKDNEELAVIANETVVVAIQSMNSLPSE
jgi:hypothetical protein